MFHLALSPIGWGILVGAGGLYLIKKSGKSVSEVAGTAVGVTTALATEGAKAVKNVVKAASPKSA